MRGLLALLVAARCSVSAALPAHAERIRDLASVQGVRPNQLIGYGLVVGLDGSGDQTTQTPFTVQSLQAMLTQLGITLPPGTSLQLKNVAAVMVTAMLPPFAQPGQPLDVTVSSLGNAKSLRGGTLLMTPLKGADGQIYAVAQGNVLVGGVGAAQGGSKVQINHLSAGPRSGRRDGRTCGGDAVCGVRPHPPRTGERRFFDRRSDGRGDQQALRRRRCRTRSMRVWSKCAHLPVANERVRFMAELENLDVSAVQPSARVIINARTGSIVMNRTVTLEPAAVAHGNLSVTISSQPIVSQPAPLSQGQTVVTERAEIQIKQDGGTLMQLPAVRTWPTSCERLNALGANAAGPAGHPAGAEGRRGRALLACRTWRII